MLCHKDVGGLAVNGRLLVKLLVDHKVMSVERSCVKRSKVDVDASTLAVGRENEARR